MEAKSNRKAASSSATYEKADLNKMESYIEKQVTREQYLSWLLSLFEIFLLSIFTYFLTYKFNLFIVPFSNASNLLPKGGKNINQSFKLIKSIVTEEVKLYMVAIAQGPPWRLECSSSCIFGFRFAPNSNRK